MKPSTKAGLVIVAVAAGGLGYNALRPVAPPTAPPAPTVTRVERLAPVVHEHDLPAVWLDQRPDAPASKGETVARLMLRKHGRDKPHVEVDAAEWAREAKRVGVVFFAVFSQDAAGPDWSGGIRDWPSKATQPAQYAAGQVVNLHKTAAAIKATRIDLGSVRVLFDIESQHSILVPLGANIAVSLGFTIGGSGKFWAANYGSTHAALPNSWLNVPSPDGNTTGIITYEANGADRPEADIDREIQHAVANGGAVVVWYNTASPTAAARIQRLRRDPDVLMLVGWTPN